MGIALLLMGMVLGNMLGHWSERQWVESELESGECTVGRRTYFVRAVDLETGDAIEADRRVD